jgi:hypothetical protein
MERVTIIAHLKEGSEQRATKLVGADPPFRAARERFGWQLDEGESIAVPASERSKSWA